MSKFSELILYERCCALDKENAALKAQVCSLSVGLQQSLLANRDLAAANEDSFQRHQAAFSAFCELKTRMDAFLKQQAKDDDTINEN